MSAFPEPADLDATVRDAHAREPLEETAALAWRLAPDRCWRDPATGRSCAPYHRVWTTLRCLGVLTSLRGDSRFLLAWLRRWAGEGRRRVLVSGAADAGMLCHVLAAWAAEGLEPAVTLVDRCPTTLAVNALYARREGVKLDLREGDALELDDPAGFDVIATHNFLGNFPAAARGPLARRWAALLRPGGGVVTTQRVRPGFAAPVSVPTGEDVEGLVRRLVEALEDHAGPLPAPPEALIEATRAYARGKERSPFRSPDEAVGPFRAAGLEILHAAPADAAARRIDRPTVPRTPGMYRLYLAARRPEAVP